MSNKKRLLPKPLDAFDSTVPHFETAARACCSAGLDAPATFLTRAKDDSGRSGNDKWIEAVQLAESSSCQGMLHRFNLLIALVYGNAFDEGGPVGLRCADGLAAARS